VLGAFRYTMDRGIEKSRARRLTEQGGVRSDGGVEGVRFSARKSTRVTNSR